MLVTDELGVLPGRPVHFECGGMSRWTLAWGVCIWLPRLAAQVRGAAGAPYSFMFSLRSRASDPAAQQ